MSYECECAKVWNGYKWEVVHLSNSPTPEQIGEPKGHWQDGGKVWVEDHDCALPEAREAKTTCEKCGGEGTLYKSKYGGNDPDVWPIGKCDDCEGSGEVELETDMERDLSSDELDLISQSFENYKTAIPVARIINDNQPGNTAIIEILCEPPTLGVGTELFAKPVLVRDTNTNFGQQVTEAKEAGIDKVALAEAVKKTAKLRVEDVGGRKERPANTVKSALNRGFNGLGSDEGISYILRHAIKYYLRALLTEGEAR